jgi:regulator of protease activity HflC (stomatin/prohibitin superfamily)
MANDLPSRFHNRPPDVIGDLLETLRETHQPLAVRLEEITDAFQRVPDTVEDDDDGNRVADFVKVTTAFLKNCDAARVAAKEPHLAAGRAVDGYFKKLMDPVEKVKLALGQRLTAFQRKKADEERRRREEIARQERERAEEEERIAREATRLAAEAKDAESRRLAAEARDRAAAAQEAAQAAREEAAVKAAEISRTRTDLGSVASLVTSWDFEVVDSRKVPRLFLTVDHAAIKAFIKASTDKKTGKCSATIEGVRIFERQTTRVM